MKEIKTLLVGVLGVLLVTGAFAQPVYAKSWNRDTSVSIQEELNRGQNISVFDRSVAKKGSVTSIEDVSQLCEQWNTVNGDPNKIVYVQNGKLASGWTYLHGWYYFDPVTHFMVRDQAKVIDGKEYFFEFDGTMVHDENVGNFYYGVDGAKAGVANPSKVTYKRANCINLVDFMPYQEFEQKVQEGKIKAEIEYGKIVGSTGVSSSVNFVYKG